MMVYMMATDNDESKVGGCQQCATLLSIYPPQEVISFKSLAVCVEATQAVDAKSSKGPG